MTFKGAVEVRFDSLTILREDALLHAEVASAMPIETITGAFDRYLNDFRPSHRRKLLAAIVATETRERVFDAIKQYVRTWDRSTQFKDYDIVRMGRWIERDAPQDFKDEVSAWARREGSRGSRALLEGMSLLTPA